MTKTDFLHTLKNCKTWQHVSSKALYSVIGLADQDVKPEWGSDDRVVYMGSDGRLWTRPLEIFVTKFKPYQGET